MKKESKIITGRLSRRRFLKKSAATGAAIAAWPGLTRAADAGPGQAMGVKIGEVTPSSATVWMRLTAAASRKRDGVVINGKVGKANRREITTPVSGLEGACPGATGMARVRYATNEALRDAKVTNWIEVTAKTDFTHHFQLENLKPGSTHYFAAETAGPGGSPAQPPILGRFETAPLKVTPSSMTFCVVTCLSYRDMGHADGFHICPAINRLNPRFVAFTGDNVYYDSDAPEALTPELARYHWQRMYSLPRQVDLLRQVATYWEKDDHDTVKDDCWPGAVAGDLTFAEGQRIFRQQVPMSETPYRTFRWGRDLQIWLTEGRDFRSPNTMKDGPEKSIWGATQKAWLKRTLAESDATWKVLISPTALVGPDRLNKNDNHANAGFLHEGNEMRGWLKENVPGNFIVICGDRHWQYHSVHPLTGLNEFAVGAASDEHAGGSPGLDKEYHRFHRVKGGFLSVTLRPDGPRSEILCEHRDVHGEVTNAWRSTRQVAG
jgi:alkaline phosphatase D